MTPHHHSLVATEHEGWGVDADGNRVVIALHEVTCVFEDDPTSDDAIVVGGIWLEPDQVDGEPFPCPVCGDQITTKDTP